MGQEWKLWDRYGIMSDSYRTAMGTGLIAAGPKLEEERKQGKRNRTGNDILIPCKTLGLNASTISAGTSTAEIIQSHTANLSQSRRQNLFSGHNEQFVNSTGVFPLHQSLAGWSQLQWHHEVGRTTQLSTHCVAWNQLLLVDHQFAFLFRLACCAWVSTTALTQWHHILNTHKVAVCTISIACLPRLVLSRARDILCQLPLMMNQLIPDCTQNGCAMMCNRVQLRLYNAGQNHRKMTQLKTW